jgi:HTH-type transcriptional regulator/antitoxin HigA
MNLVVRFPLRHIRSDEELAQATKIVLELEKRDDLTEGETDYFDVLTDMIEAYENVHHPVKEA